MLKDRKKGQSSKWLLRWKVKDHASGSKVKWRLLADRSCTSGALLRTSHELVLSKFARLIFLKWRLLADRSCISIAPYGQFTN